MSESQVSIFIFSVLVMLSLSLAMGHFFEIMKMPRVIGEIVAGILLGWSVFGQVAPELYEWLYGKNSGQDNFILVFYWMGLILLMFTAGFKISSKINKDDGKIVSRLVLGGLCIPFTFGFYASGVFPNAAKADHIAYALVLGSACAVTSIPVITKIFMDLGLEKGCFAKRILSAAAIQDLILWAIISIALSIQHGDAINATSIITKFISVILFSVIIVFVGPVIVRFLGQFVKNKTPEDAIMGHVILVCLAIVGLASLLSVHIVYGSLLAGIVVGHFSSEKLDSVKHSITNFSGWFFVPLYFSLVGFKINLNGDLSFVMAGIFLAASSLVKIFSIMIFMLRSKEKPLDIIDYGVIMNTRGGPGIVLASVAFSANIVDQSLFFALVISSIITSLIAGVWLRFRKDRDLMAFK